MMGYSSGSHMVSRAINNFPGMVTPSGVAFPKLSTALIISGGSYQCYRYDTKSGSLSNMPANYLPCIKPKEANGGGCCPHDKTEQNFDDGSIPWDEHPPTLLLQPETDSYADPGATGYYYDVMSSKSKQNVCRVLAPGSLHGVNPEHVSAMLSFVRTHV